MATTCKLIGKVELSAAAANIEFTSIPGTYTDLFLLASLRINRSGENNDNVMLRFNAATTNYSDRALYGNGSTAASDSSTLTGIRAASVPGPTATSNTFGSCEIYIPNYAGSSNKSVSAASALENNATFGINWASAGLWSDTSAVTSIRIYPRNGTEFFSGSSAFLYGITKS